MCDFAHISRLIIAAQVAYLAVLAMLIIATANSASLFLAFANVPLMIAAIVANATAAAVLSAARDALDKCFGGPCEEELLAFRGEISALLASAMVFTILLIGAAIIAPVPVAGAVTLGIVIGFLMGVVAVFSGGMSFLLARTVTAFNDCQASKGSPPDDRVSTGVVVLGYVTAVVTAVAVAAGVGSGKAPMRVSFTSED